VTRRRYRTLLATVAGLAACCLAISLWVAVRLREDTAVKSVSSVLLQPRRDTSTNAGATAAAARSHLHSTVTSLSACEGQIEHAKRRLPTVAIVGASYTAGTGPNNPELSWAVRLARTLRWNAVVYGVPGAGYVRPSLSHRGPISRMLTTERLAALHPSLVIVQAGFDDMGVPAATEQQRVSATVDQIRAAAPGARIALITTFWIAPGASPALYRTDHTIVAAATAADQNVIVMDPLADRWTFPRAHDGLHPTSAGDAWIAGTVAGTLRAHGIRAAAASARPIICDVAVGERRPATT
jgi:acyl-CoA thioesterase-1